VTWSEPHRLEIFNREASTDLLLLNSSTDPNLVFLDNGKLSVEINLAEPVEPFLQESTEYLLRLEVEVSAK
jgi:hypothetical protein